MHQHMNRLLLIALALFSSGVIARAGDQVPFKGTLSGQVISVTPVSDEVLVFRVTVTGIATHLGSFKGEAEIAQNVVTGSYSGTFTWIAANGDTVTGTFTGQLIPTATPGLFDNIEEITVTGGTRRFSNATGHAVAAGQLDQTTLSFLFPFKGTISSIGSNN